jgi:glutamine cyclotransferase
MSIFFLLLLTLTLFISCKDPSFDSGTDNREAEIPIPIINYSVAQYFPHDTTLFTEGLLFHDGALFESTGSPENITYARSLIGISDLETGKFEPKIELDKNRYFGEGIVFLNNKLYQLTYKNQVCFVYDAKTFQQLG